MFHLNPTTARRHAARATAVMAALAALAVGIRWGTFAVGGSDSYGYVSQAETWAQGRMSVLEPRVLSMPWPNSESTMIPFGYRMSRKTPGALVPKYPPGLPLVMAAFRKLAGRDGPFFVVPVLGALSVWLTFLLGRSIAGPSAGALAAVLLAASPTFLFQVTQPISDVPAMAWWLAAITLLIRPTDLHVAASGAAASLAVLTRPNLAPMVVVVVGLLLAQSRGIDWRIACRFLVASGSRRSRRAARWPGSTACGTGPGIGPGNGAPDGVVLDVQRPGEPAPVCWLARRHAHAMRARRAAHACAPVQTGVGTTSGRLGLLVTCAGRLRPLPGVHALGRLVVHPVPAALVPVRGGGSARGGLVVAARWLAPSRAAVIAAAAAVALAASFTSVAADRGVFRLAAHAQRFPEVGAWIARETRSTAVVFAEEHSG